ncbi:RNA polymerase subunit sigma [Pollutimonas subterranea]|uniref:RNA polymerase subunit sigma n=1 Tax=Pollutimonas subterranea TaxID=2045210 RepID=A0A2N4TYT1_9BURK|nr:sigma-70 family RNA polymerase sigma factor [Pollutimonas subterranea]PLC47899.1 RNA polymerase subunit sigma [Pollutimonas subterranea]
MAADHFDYETTLQACASGDQQALQRLYLQDGKRLMGVALRIVRDRQLAEDVLHDAFVSIWRKAHTFDRASGSGRGWIYSIVRYRALNVVRGRERETQVDEEMLESMDAAQLDHLPDAFMNSHDLGRLHDCLAALDTSRRNSLLYAYVDGCSHREIAERLKSPIGTVKAWIRRGLMTLRECMG